LKHRFFILKQGPLEVSIPVVREGNIYATSMAVFVFTQGEGYLIGREGAQGFSPFALSLVRGERQNGKV